MTDKMTQLKEDLPEDKRYLVGPTIIFGYLIGTKQSVRVSQYNRVAKEFGEDLVDEIGLKSYSIDIYSNKTLIEYMSKVITGELRIEDLYEVTAKEMYANTLPYVVAHEESLASAREFRQAMRNGAHMERLLQGLRTHMSTELSGVQFHKSPPMIAKRSDDEYSMIINLSDWHVGAIVYNEDTGGYSYQILKERLDTYLEEVLNLVLKFDISKVYVIHLGDWIEHINMRNVNQAFEAEFSATEQIVKATRLIIDFLERLSSHVAVTFGGIGGNHDRFQGNKADKVYNDNVALVILDTLFLIKEQGGLANVDLIDNRDDVYSLEFDLAGRHIKAVHGDHEGKKVDQKIPKHIKHKAVDILLMGHIHTSRNVQEDYARFHHYCGSPMGANSYSKEHNFPTTKPSQSIILLPHDNDGNIVYNVML